MGWLSVLLSIIASVLLYGTGHKILFVLALISAAACFWSWGIMHNYATEQAKKRQNYPGGFYDITEAEAEYVPDWISWINMGFSLLGLILLIAGIVIKLK